MTKVTKGLDDFNSYLLQANLDAKPHQHEAVKWALEREHDPHPPNGVRGGLLADEMGLGKTIVMMGLIVANFLPRTLVVLPLALLDQWASEIERTMGHRPMVFHGNNKKNISDTELKSAPIVLTTYGHISMKTPNEEGTRLHELTWGRVIFDEAHHLRNMKTSNHIGAVALKATARWLMTGTPIQNRITDFYSLCVVMGMTPEFYTNEENLAVIGKTFLLKRTKADAGIKLPPLQIHEEIVDWANEDEKRLAEDIHGMLNFSHVNPRQVDNMIASLDHGTLALLVRGRQSCVYPALIKKQVEKFVQIGLLADSKAFERATSHSSKLDAVERKIAERRHNRRSKIVFCHYRGEIDELSARFEKKGMTVVTLDGRTPNSEREKILKSAPDVLILQIQTGCEGLNLQQFSEIYFVSPHWNPAVEDQAVARAHRIGQNEKVDVFRFIMEGFDDEEETCTLDAHSKAVQDTKRKAMRFVEGDVGEKDDDDKDDDELARIDKRHKTKEGYLKDGFTVDSN